MSNVGKELYLEANNGKTQMWKADINPVPTPEGFVEIIATFGFTDGKKQTKSTYVKSGKNKGKKNETTITEQAVLKCNQMYDDKIKNKAMVFDIDDWVKPKRPSLASSYGKRKKYVKNVKQWLIDKKLDGNRTYRFSDGSYQSKSGDVVTPITHIENELKLLASSFDVLDVDIDGEFYKHGLDLQQITGIVNTEKEEDRNKKTDVKLEYHIFDIFINNDPLANALDRYTLLKSVFELANEKYNFKYLVLNEKELIDNDDSIIEAKAKEFISQGYEGAILRDASAPYYHSKNPSDRNDAMLKVKFMLDDEFLILDIIENENELGTPKFIIQLPNNLTNEVVMSGKKDDNKIYLTDCKKYIGKYLKVQYQAYTKYGRLEFPVGLEIRVGVLTETGFDPKF